MAGIIRAPRSDNFSLIPNSSIRDARLSYRSRGVLCRLLSNADGYRMTAEDLARESITEGRAAILTALKELRAAGYVVVVKRQGTNGRWGTETYVFDTPQATGVRLPNSGSPNSGSPNSGSPDAGSPDAGSPDAIKKTSKKKEQKKTTTTPNPSRSKPAGGGGVDGVIEDIREMLVAQARASGKASPAAWVGAAVRRIRKDGIDADTLAQLEDWKAGQARAEATARAVQAARHTSPCSTTTPSATPISSSSYPGRSKLMEAISSTSANPMPAGAAGG